MKSFFKFLSQELAATMVALAGFVASVAAIADAIKKNKKVKIKWRYVWLIAALSIFLLSLAYLAGQYTAQSRTDSKESIHMENSRPEESTLMEKTEGETDEKETTESSGGYAIYLSTDSAVMEEKFKIYIIPNEEEVTQIFVHAEGPSGQENTYEWKREKEYLIDEEPGTWKIWATIVSEAGIYEGNKPEEFVTIVISP